MNGPILNAYPDSIGKKLSECVNVLSKEEDNKVSLFKNWIIGEPVKYENQILIPVRAYSENGYLNLLISTTNDVTIKIYNVQIEKWGSN